MLNTNEILKSFDLPTNINAFVQQTSRRSEDDPFFIEELAVEFGINVEDVEEQQQLAYVQYAIVELMQHPAMCVEAAVEVAKQKTNGLYDKHPYLQPKEETEEAKATKEAKPSDKKKQAQDIYDANKDTKTLAELVNMIAEQLQITKPNARYYVSRCFGHKATK